MNLVGAGVGGSEGVVGAEGKCEGMIWGGDLDCGLGAVCDEGVRVGASGIGPAAKEDGFGEN